MCMKIYRLIHYGIINNIIICLLSVIQVRSTNEIKLYAVNTGNGTTDPFVVYPTSYLGTSYFAASYNPEGRHRSHVLLIAIYNGTRISVKIPIVHRGMTLTLSNVTYTEGETVHLHMNAYQTLTLACLQDLIGLKVSVSDN